MKALLTTLALLSTISFAEPPPPEAQQQAANTPPYQIGRQIISESFKPPTKKVKVAFFDADSTLRIAPSDSVSANSGRDVWLLPLVTKEIARLNAEGYLVVIVSNQGGVSKPGDPPPKDGKPRPTLEAADSALRFVGQMAEWLNPAAKIHYYDFAENYDNNRKPKTGMFERVAEKIKEKFGEDYELDKEQSFMSGDSSWKKGVEIPADKLEPGQPKIGQDFSDSDRLVAEAYGIKFIDPAKFFGWRQYGIERFTAKPQIDAFYKAHPELKGPKPVGPCPFPSLVPEHNKFREPKP